MSDLDHEEPTVSNWLQPARQASVTWAETATAEFPYAARVDGRHWRIRLGDFPAEPLYALFIDGIEIGSFDDWPDTWNRPRP